MTLPLTTELVLGKGGGSIAKSKNPVGRTGYMIERLYRLKLVVIIAE
jgi:hypothetical protein